MLCARPPFDYPGVGELLGAHLHEPVTPPTTINPAITPALEAIVMKTLAKKPEERHQSMGALAADLARLLGQTGANRPTTFPPATVALPPSPAPTTLSKAAAQVPVSEAPTMPARPRRNLVVPLPPSSSPLPAPSPSPKPPAENTPTTTTTTTPDAGTAIAAAKPEPKP